MELLLQLSVEKMKLTAKQEKFARELAKGTSQYKAYCIAYPLQGKNSKRETLDNNAYNLAKNSEIIARVNKLQEKALNHIKYDIEAHYNELELLKALALTPSGKDGTLDVKSAIKAVELKGKVKGLYVTRVEQTNYNHNFTPEDEDILRQEAKEEGISWEQYCEREGIS